MNHKIQVSNAQSGEAIVSATANSEANAAAAASALKTAFPDACVHYQVANDGKQGRGMSVSLNVFQQSLVDFVRPQAEATPAFSPVEQSAAVQSPSTRRRKLAKKRRSN